MVCVDSFSRVINESSSKGNQHKFYKDGVWVKIDNRSCSEGLAEEFVSLFEDCIYDFPHVEYRSDKVLYNEMGYVGCYSYSMFNDPNISFVSLRHLFNKSGIRLNIFLSDPVIENNIKAVVNTVLNITGINTLDYFGRLVILDCLIINEDRHYMNLGICQDLVTGNFYEAPCFDNGSSLFCTDWTYRPSKSLEENIQRAKGVARPFSKFFDKQLEGILRLGCKPLVINKSRVEWLLRNYYNNLYSDELNKRVKEVLINRLRYYEGKAFIFN